MYRAALVITAGDPPPPWGEFTRTVLPEAFRRAGLDWREAEHGRSGTGLLIVAPAATAARLAREFARELAEATARLPGPPRLGAGLAVGMCHRDGTGWYGDAVTTARELARPPAAGDAAAVRLTVSEAVRDLASGDVVPAGTAAAPEEISVLGETARRTAPGSPVRLIAEAVDAVALPVAAFAEELPVLLSPDVAPSDVLAWMYEVLGVDLPRLLDDRHGRRLVSGLVGCYRRRGTARGLADLIALRYGVGVQVVDPGSATWSAVPETPVRQPPGPVTVLLDTDEPLNGLDRVIRSALPAGVGYRVSRRPRGAPGPAR
ncbi:hypothetical protein Asp14428_34230 [Actinoplanes sp. NBRC 14428]|nr:hypothetical protein Asp14428_34230 [Actinoplanes sp. NBRC 14428]